MQYHLAVDLGATTGRHILAHLEDGKIVTEEIFRFQTYSKLKDGNWIWECEDLAEKVMEGMAVCAEQGKIPATMGICTWGADFVLLDKEDKLLGDAMSYRDEMAMVNMSLDVDNLLDPAAYFSRTGIGKMPFDSVYQLMTIQRSHPEVLEQTGKFLMLSSYLNYQLTGKFSAEYTSSVTTGLINSTTRTWDDDTIRALGFPREMFLELDEAGSVLGTLQEDVRRRVGFDTTVILVSGHDTTSAFSAIPSLDPDSVTVSSGTWSLLGIITDKAVTTPAAKAAGYTNEGAVPNLFRLSKPIIGMFILEKLKKELCPDKSYDDVIALAKSAGPVDSVIDLSNLMFLMAEDMAAEVRKDCEESGQPVPETDAQLFAVFFHSLVTHYRRAIEDLEKITGRRFTSFNIIGGGSRNEYINQLAAEELGIPVFAGPHEATVAGNIISQLLATSLLKDREEAARVCRASFPVKEYYSGVVNVGEVPFRSYAMRLRREGIKNIRAMAYRLGDGFAVATPSASEKLSATQLEQQMPLVAAVFRAHPEMNAVLRTAPQHCAEAARSEKSIPPVLDDTAQIIGTSIRVCESDNSGSVLKALKKCNACLLRDGDASGVLAVGPNLERALAATLIAEKSVKAFMEGKLLGGVKELSRPYAFLMHMVYEKFYSHVDTSTPQDSDDTALAEIPAEELRLREAIIACGKKLRKHNLVQGTWGNIGVRLDDRYMLVTPSGLDYERLSPNEIVKVDMETLEYEGSIKPTSEKALHALLMHSAPEARCVIHSHPVNSSVFAAARQGLEISGEEDQQLLGSYVPCSQPALSGTKQFSRIIDREMGAAGKACFISNHGMVVRGRSIDEAFAACEALERQAIAFIQQRAEEDKEASKKELGNRELYEGEIDTPVGRVLAQVSVDRTQDPLVGDFVAMNTTTPLSEIAMTEDGFTGKTMFKAGFLKLPVDLDCHFAGTTLTGKAMTKMGDLEFTFTRKN